MTDKTGGPGAPSPHPLIEKFAAASPKGDPSDVVKLQGYVGPGDDADHIRLYPSLDDLSEHLEIAKADIVHHADAPESVLPHGGTFVWVKKGANVALHRTQKTRTTADMISGAISDANLSARVAAPMRASELTAVPVTELDICTDRICDITDRPTACFRTECGPCDVTKFRTCKNTCLGTCLGTCDATCNATCNTCAGTCLRTCNTCARTCLGTCAGTCIRTCRGECTDLTCFQTACTNHMKCTVVGCMTDVGPCAYTEMRPCETGRPCL